MTAWALYVLRTRQGYLYTGIATDVRRRIEEHSGGRGAKALRGRGPLALVFSCRLGDRSTALRTEARVKRQAILRNARSQGAGGVVSQFALHHTHGVSDRRQRTPLRGTSTHVHEHGAAVQRR